MVKNVIPFIFLNFIVREVLLIIIKVTNNLFTLDIY
jgi:hypothetical protein